MTFALRSPSSIAAREKRGKKAKASDESGERHLVERHIFERLQEAIWCYRRETIVRNIIPGR